MKTIFQNEDLKISESDLDYGFQEFLFETNESIYNISLDDIVGVSINRKVYNEGRSYREVVALDVKHLSTPFYIYFEWTWAYR